VERYFPVTVPKPLLLAYIVLPSNIGKAIAFGAVVYTTKLTVLSMLFYSQETMRIPMAALCLIGWNRRSTNASYSKYNGSCNLSVPSRYVAILLNLPIARTTKPEECTMD
jgi:hypothetical protein